MSPLPDLSGSASHTEPVIESAMDGLDTSALQGGEGFAVNIPTHGPGLASDLGQGGSGGPSFELVRLGQQGKDGQASAQAPGEHLPVEIG